MLFLCRADDSIVWKSRVVVTAVSVTPAVEETLKADVPEIAIFKHCRRMSMEIMNTSTQSVRESAQYLR